MNFIGTATPLTAADISRAADFLSCEPGAVAAVAAVETSGSGFLADGRPRILFEAKTFHRLTAGRFDGSHPNISSPVWDRSLYGGSGAHQYDRLTEALALDEVAALKSASWGMFQIMGENCQRCGFADVHDFVALMLAGEGAHLNAFAHFVNADAHLLAAIRAKDWATFARIYNGPDFKSNAYDIKLAKAYDRGAVA